MFREFYFFIAQDKKILLQNSLESQDFKQEEQAPFKFAIRECWNSNEPGTMGKAIICLENIGFIRMNIKANFGKIIGSFKSPCS